MILDQEPEKMKDMSLFLLKNTFGAKMKKGFRNFCNGDNSTSTLDQHKPELNGPYTYPISARPLVNSPVRRENQPTLEEMILQLEMEEKMARRENDVIPHRMSCVNSSDILRTARNALNQYPRFSLDGKDSMYRSSFTPNLRERKIHPGGNKNGLEGEGKRRLMPAVVGGESVIWCKPGIVAKLMGLDAMPIPLKGDYKRERLSVILRRQNLRKRGEVERRKRMDQNESARRKVGACSRTGYCAVNPVEFDFQNDESGWPTRRFV